MLQLALLCLTFCAASYGQIDPRSGDGDIVPRGSSSFMYNSQPATPDQVPPSQAVFVFEHFDVYKANCGGVLIAPDKVLTVAHCLHPITKICLGCFNITEAQAGTDPNAQLIDVHWTKAHEDYKKEGKYKNDIGYVYLRTPAQLNDKVKLAKLTTKTNADLVGETVTLVGYGLTPDSVGPTPSTIPLRAQFKGQEAAKCEEELRDTPFDTKLCVQGSGDPVPDSCEGDSGFPLVKGGEVLGLLSYGTARCQGNRPQVYTSVAAFKDWIDAN